MKFLLVICFVAVFGAVTEGAGITFGEIGANDELLHTQTFNVPHRDGEVQKAVVEYSGNATITGILIHETSDGSTSNFSRIKDGVGYKKATIKLKDNGKGIFAYIYIFGKE